MFKYANSVRTTLAAGPSAGATSFTVTSTAGFPVVTTASKDFTVFRLDDGTAYEEDVVVTDINTGTNVCTCAALVNAHATSTTVDTDVVNKVALDQVKDDALTGGPFNAVTGSATLVLGVSNIVTITSAAATLTIPSGTYKGQACRIMLAASSTKLATLSCTGTTVNGQIMWAGETAYLMWDGAAWVKQFGTTLPLVCSIYRNAAANIAGDSAEHIIPFDATYIDNSSLMADLANNAILVKRTGKYSIKVECAWVSLSAAQNRIILILYKNAAAALVYEITNVLAITQGPTVGARVMTLTAADSMTAKVILVPVSGTTAQALNPAAETTFLSLTEIPSW